MKQRSDNKMDPHVVIDAICERLRAALEQGQDSPIESLLLDVPETLRDQALEELVGEEAQIRAERGEKPAWSEYAERFPNDREAAWRGFRHYDPDLPHSEWATISTAGLDKPSSTAGNPESNPTAEPMPDQLGNYRIVAELGSGTFGRVYKGIAADEIAVAIKQLKSKWDSNPKVRQQFLDEAQRMTQFDHPGIVRVFELNDQTLPPFFVQEFISGGDLSKRIKQGKLPVTEATEFAIQIADALAHVHSFKLYHRDLKPANVLIDAKGLIRIADFGLALADADRWQQPKAAAGTLLYMPPEQLQGEWELLQSRCDIWSLGVIYYEMLTGERPFQQKELDRLRHEIANRVPPSPRDLDQTIPRRLNQLCMSCLEKNIRQRPGSAADFRDDLQEALTALAQPSASQPLSADEKTATPEKIVYPSPTLRRFTADQAELYLRLMPKSYSNREELPELIHYWKKRIGETDPDKTFRIGVLVGVSGCGKSSLLEAGLLPRLPDQVNALLVQASEADTEVQLLKSLQKAFPNAGADATGWSLPEWTRRLREGELLQPGQKAVLVLDQFEQWLHVRRDDPVSQLRDALQQCDGQHLQSILCVREGFHSSLMRFVNSLDTELDTERNYATAHRFDIGHARCVLEQFGRGVGRLNGPLSEEQNQFLDRAVEELARTDQDGVRSVRLVVLALVMAQRDWTVEELETLGGLDGIGRQFLLDSFEGRTAPEQYRRLLPAAMRVLERLVPEQGLEIKDSRTYDEMLRASELATSEFDTLLEILVRKLFLVTPVDTDFGPVTETTADSDHGQTANGAHRYYQLTHDFLVPSVRQWIEFKEEQSPGGRARLLLRRLTGAWMADHHNKRHLPSLPEYLQIRRRTDKSRWSNAQRALMSRATRFHGVRFSLATAALALLITIGMVVRSNVARQQEATRIQGLVDSLINAEPDQMPDIVARLDENAELAQAFLNPLKDADAQTQDEKRAQLHARLACVSRDPSLVEPLKEQLLTNKPAYIGPIRELLRPYANDLTDDFWTILRDENIEPDRRFRAALALAEYVPATEEDSWTKQDLAFVARELVSSNAEFQPLLRRNLQPISERLQLHIEAIFHDQEASDAKRLSAANALADYAAEETQRLANLLTFATPEQFAVLYPLVAANPLPAGIDNLAKIAAELPPGDLGAVERIAFGQRRANAAVTLLRLGGREKMLPVFNWTDDPEALTQFIFRCRPRDVSVDALLGCLQLVSDAPPDRYSKDARYALLLAIGEFTLEEIPESRRDSLLNQLADWYRNDPSSGVHGAAGWLLRQWDQVDIARKVDQTAVPYSPDREWFTMAITVTPATPEKKPAEKEPESKPPSSEATNPVEGKTNETGKPEMPPDQSEPPPPKTFYYTFIVFPAGDYTIGSVDDEPDRPVQEGREQRHQVTLTRPFALLDREITMEELIAFSLMYAGYMKQFDAQPSDAGFAADWYDSVSYCHWLGQQSGLSEAEQAYADPESLDKELYPREPNPSANWAPRNWPLELGRRGFRLPTESEREVASRSGARTAYGYGSDESLLGRFGWFLGNSGERVHPPRELHPNVRGLYDLHGNAYEWSHDWYDDYGAETVTDPLGAKKGSSRVGRGGSWSYDAALCRSADRFTIGPTIRSVSYGFRLALSPSVKSPEAEQDRVAETAGEGTEGASSEQRPEMP